MFEAVVSMQTILIWIALCLLVVSLVGYLWRRDERKEDQNVKISEAAGHVGDMFRMPRVAHLIRRAGAEDRSGFRRECINFVDLIEKANNSEDEGLHLFDENFYIWQLPARLNDAEQRVKIKAIVQDVVDAEAAKAQRNREAIIKELELEGYVVTQHTATA